LGFGIGGILERTELLFDSRFMGGVLVGAKVDLERREVMNDVESESFEDREGEEFILGW
jgi:hypothetical protein